LLEPDAEVPLAALVAVVDGGVDDVDAVLEGFDESGGVLAVGDGVGVAEITPHSQGRQGEPERAFPVPLVGLGVILGVGCGPLGGGLAGDHGRNSTPSATKYPVYFVAVRTRAMAASARRSPASGASLLR